MSDRVGLVRGWVSVEIVEELIDRLPPRAISQRSKAGKLAPQTSNLACVAAIGDFVTDWRKIPILVELVVKPLPIRREPRIVPFIPIELAWGV